jgi:hypothetical protein
MFQPRPQRVKQFLPHTYVPKQPAISVRRGKDCGIRLPYHDTICRSSRRQISGGPVRGEEDEGQGEGRRFVKRKGLSGINHRRPRDVTAARLRNILPPMSCGLSHWYREAKQGWDGCFGFLPLKKCLSIPPLTFDIRGIPSPNSLKKSFLPKDT